MTNSSGLLQRLRLRHVVFGALLIAGIIPLAVSSVLLIWQNREIIEQQEREQLVRAASAVSRQVDDHLLDLREDAEQLGIGALALGSAAAGGIQEYLHQFQSSHEDVVAVRLLSPEGRGPEVARHELPAEITATLDEAYERALDQGETVHRFVVEPETREPAVVLAVPVSRGGAQPELVVELLSRMRLVEAVFSREAQGAVEVLLLGQGRLLWSEGASPESLEAWTTGFLGRMGSLPVNLVTEYRLPTSGEWMFAQVSPVRESGWVVVVQKPMAAAFTAVDQMIFNSVLSSVILVGLALLLSLLAARRVSRPIQDLTQASHEIASGNFGRRIQTHGLLSELADLGHDFNRMSGHVERYIGELKEAARANRDLFIGSLRAFAAAIDAKDPYTRGHSERVAAVSRIIARYLGMAEDFQERIWIAGILHDVGKIGVEDRVLKKGGQLTDEEFAQIKMHTLMGAEILSSIDQLKETIPAVRWHHEAWNGRGYPDGLKGEEIPLIARIVAVADTFDAITTNRPYQKAYTLEFAVETIIKLTGARFDAKVTTAFLRAYEKGEIQPAHERPTESDPLAERPPSDVRARVLSMT